MDDCLSRSVPLPCYTVDEFFYISRNKVGYKKEGFLSLHQVVEKGFVFMNTKSSGTLPHAVLLCKVAVLKQK